MDSAKLFIGRWLYTDENTGIADGTVLEFKRSKQKDSVSANFLMEEQAINAKMECTLTSESVVIEEYGDEICNRYEGVISDDGRSITGTWLCTKSSMDCCMEGDSGKFELTKDPAQLQLFVGKWAYTDDYTAAEDGTLLQISAAEEGCLQACFLVEDDPTDAAKCDLYGKEITIHEVAETMSTDYIGAIDSSGNVITGTWKCIKSEDGETNVGDSGPFTLTKEAGQ